MARTTNRRWTDPRDGTEWEIHYNPPVELDTKRVRDFRERLMFRSGDGAWDVPAVYGSDLETLTDADLQGLLDQARDRPEDEEAAGG
jgi:hypothetical protein